VIKFHHEQFGVLSQKPLRYTALSRAALHTFTVVSRPTQPPTRREKVK